MKTGYFIIIQLSLILFFQGSSFAQNLVGFVYEINDINEKVFIPGVNIRWQGTTSGVVKIGRAHV